MQIIDKDYSIGEVANLTGVKPYVLRYWEHEFHLLQPMRGEGRHRRYRKEDVEKTLYIRDLLWKKGYTISGAKKKILEDKKEAELVQDFPSLVREIKKELKEMMKVLNK